MQLKAANVVGGRRVGQTLEECCEALTALNVAALGVGPQLAGGHVLDHALTQRTDGGISAHGELLLSEVSETSIIPQDGAPTPLIISSQTGTQPSIGHPAQRLSRQRFRTVTRTRHFGLIGLRSYEYCTQRPIGGVSMFDFFRFLITIPFFLGFVVTIPDANAQKINSKVAHIGLPRGSAQAY